MIISLKTYQMEIIEPLKLLFIIVMFFVSYKYINDPPPAITFDEEEPEEKIQDKQEAP